jgi:hypothetical protein
VPATARRAAATAIFIVLNMAIFLGSVACRVSRV